MSLDPKSIHNLLQAKKLRFILHKSEKIRQINKLLQELLPEELLPHVRVLNLQEDTLILAVTSAAWATRLKFIFQELLRNLHYYDSLSQLRKIQCKMTPPSDATHTARKPALPIIRLSNAGKNTINASAENMRNPLLQAALRRLART